MCRTRCFTLPNSDILHLCSMFKTICHNEEFLVLFSVCLSLCFSKFLSSFLFPSFLLSFFLLSFFLSFYLPSILLSFFFLSSFFVSFFRSFFLSFVLSCFLSFVLTFFVRKTTPLPSVFIIDPQDPEQISPYRFDTVVNVLVSPTALFFISI